MTSSGDEAVAEGTQFYDVSAEYDDATRVARESELPGREVIRRVEAAVSEKSGSAQS